MIPTFCLEWMMLPFNNNGVTEGEARLAYRRKSETFMFECFI